MILFISLSLPHETIRKLSVCQAYLEICCPLNKIKFIVTILLFVAWDKIINYLSGDLLEALLRNSGSLSGNALRSITGDVISNVEIVNCLGRTAVTFKIITERNNAKLSEFIKIHICYFCRLKDYKPRIYCCWEEKG